MSDNMYAGKLTLEFRGQEYDLGYLTSYKENHTKQSSTTPIPTKGSDNTFAIDGGGKMTLSLELTRKNPVNAVTGGTDSTRWTNAYWYKEIDEIVDQWQARYNGFILRFVPSTDNPYMPARSFRGYIKTFGRVLPKGYTDIIKVSMNFVVGTRLVQTRSTNQGQEVSKFQVSMSNADGTKWYALLSGDSVNCIEEYTMEGGMEQPFESISMVIPKNRLGSVAPDLVDNIVPGYSKLVVNAVGKSTMTVVKCKLSNKSYRITAYCDAEAIKGYKLSNTASYTPWYWIKRIITSGEYGFAFQESGNPPTFIYSIPNKTAYTDELTFKKDTNVWYILQVCALYLGCKVFFANGNAYCINCLGDDIMTNYTSPLDLHTKVDLYTYDTAEPEYARTTGSVSLGDEGIDTVINSQTIECQNTSGSKINVTYNDDEKIIRSGNKQYIPELIEGGGFSQATTVARNIVRFRREPQQSVTFTFKELESTGSDVQWVPFFYPNSRADEISSTVDDFTITNESVDRSVAHLPQKLLLSQYERHYPEGTTTYTFGAIANVDLAVSTSQIVSNQDNGSL